MYQVQSNIILKGDLANSITAALVQLDILPSQSEKEDDYRLGFRTALASIAIAHGLNLPQVRNAQGEAKRAAHKRLPTDDRL